MYGSLSIYGFLCRRDLLVSSRLQFFSIFYMNNQIEQRNLLKLRGPLSTTFAFVPVRGIGDDLLVGRVAEPWHDNVQGAILKERYL